MELVCSRCGLNARDPDAIDWCRVCELPLCVSCMDQGCCEVKPARSGRETFIEFHKPIEPQEPGQAVASSTPQDLPETFVKFRDAEPCCPLAMSAPCGCDRLWVCAIHGKKHVGRHD